MDNLTFGLLVLAVACIGFFMLVWIVRKLAEVAGNNKLLVYVGVPCGLAAIRAMTWMMNEALPRWSTELTDERLQVVAIAGSIIAILTVIVKFKSKK